MFIPPFLFLFMLTVFTARDNMKAADTAAEHAPKSAVQ
jgi:hypothetical protein